MSVEDAPTLASAELQPGARRRWRPARQDLLWLGVTEFVTAMGAMITLQIWRADLRVPFGYGSDFNLAMMAARNADNGWIYSARRLAAPFGQHLEDFRGYAGDSFHLLGLKALGLLTDSPALIVNTYYLLGFLAVAATAFLALRLLKVRAEFAAALSVLYSLLPYHFLRNTSHVFLSGYFAVPLACLLLIRQFGPCPLLDLPGRRPFKALLRSPGAAGALAICLLISTTGAYYAVFTALLLLFVAAVRSLSTRSWRPFAAGACLISVILGAIGLATTPGIIKSARQGPNTEVGIRSYFETEFYGLHITNLVLPVGGHRLPALADLKAETAHSPVPGEGSEALGLVGAGGMMLLLGAGFLRMTGGGGPRVDLIGQLAACLVFALLLGTIAGFSGVIAAFGFTQIRAWDRISVFIAFFAMAGLGVFLSQCRRPRRFQRLPFEILLAGCLVAVGIPDQTTAKFAPAFESLTAQWKQDAEFFAVVEREFGDQDVFQLPYVRFPENAPVVSMLDYDHVRGYLQTLSVRWSYGAVKGRDGEWQRQVVSGPGAEVVRRLALAGFSAIYIDRNGYSDGGQAIESALRSEAGPAVAESADRRMVVYDVRAVRGRLDAALGPERRASLGSLVTHPLTLSWGPGFFPVDVEGPLTRRRAASEAVLRLSNPLSVDRDVDVSFSLDTRQAMPMTIEMTRGGQRQEYALTGNAIPVRVPLRIGAKERVELRFRSVAEGGPAPVDKHEERFRITDVVALDASVSAASGPGAP